MELQEHKYGAVTVLKPDGPLVGEDSELFKLKLIELLGLSMGRCVVDASAMPYVDSQGLEALVDANDEVACSGHNLKLCGLSDTVRQVLDLTELSSHFEHFADVNTAVRSFL